MIWLVKKQMMSMQFYFFHCFSKIFYEKATIETWNLSIWNLHFQNDFLCLKKILTKFCLPRPWECECSFLSSSQLFLRAKCVISWKLIKTETSDRWFFFHSISVGAEWSFADPGWWMQLRRSSGLQTRMLGEVSWRREDLLGEIGVSVG